MLEIDKVIVLDHHIKNKDYIIERNKAFKNKKLKQFILENSNNIFKLTPPIIYYGE